MSVSKKPTISSSTLTWSGFCDTVPFLMYGIGKKFFFLIKKDFFIKYDNKDGLHGNAKTRTKGAGFVWRLSLR